MYYKIAVAEITNFVICSFPKYWIPLQAFLKIVPSFQEHSFHKILHNDCFRIWLSLNWGWLNPWYSGRLAFPLSFQLLDILEGWLSLFLFSLFYVFCSWKDFRVRKVVMGNILADAKNFYHQVGRHWTAGWHWTVIPFPWKLTD